MNTPQQAKPRPRLATWLRLAALVAAVVIDLIVWPKLVADQNSTTFNVLFVAIPILLTLMPVLLGLTHRETATTLTTWICAGLLTVGAILFGLTTGVYFLFAALILVIAAIVQSRGARQPRQPASTM